jgi:hypothetical protein
MTAVLVSHPGEACGCNDSRRLLPETGSARCGDIWEARTVNWSDCDSKMCMGFVGNQSAGKRRLRLSEERLIILYLVCGSPSGAVLASICCSIQDLYRTVKPIS